MRRRIEGGHLGSTQEDAQRALVLQGGFVTNAQRRKEVTAL
ncbi:MAG: hypothetical protein ACI8PT_005004 [Gammaproteobacteria bacterium]|jgi:hypothetical protein